MLVPVRGSLSRAWMMPGVVLVMVTWSWSWR